MREIKFRAWHKDRSFMLFVGDDWGTTKPLDCCVYANQGQPVILMQYTGIHDKNGKEIYEGDIISEGGIEATIVWDDNQARFCYRTKTGSAGLYLFAGEVTGNIYEVKESET